jgi:hypothetical protein
MAKFQKGDVIKDSVFGCTYTIIDVDHSCGKYKILNEGYHGNNSFFLDRIDVIEQKCIRIGRKEPSMLEEAKKAYTPKFQKGDRVKNVHGVGYIIDDVLCSRGRYELHSYCGGNEGVKFTEPMEETEANCKLVERTESSVPEKEKKAYTPKFKAKDIIQGKYGQ